MNATPKMLLAAAVGAAVSLAAVGGDLPQRVLELPRGPNNPRNSEGDFARLKDGRILFVYSHYVGTSGSDHAAAYLASRVSHDEGRTWSATDRVEVENEGGMNVMSVSLLRLKDGRLALFYLRKNSLRDCRPVMRVSTDEAQTWSKPVVCVPDAAIGYYVLNNARAVQLSSGRLVLPLCHHPWVEDKKNPGKGWLDMDGEITAALSDDGGATWRMGRQTFRAFLPGNRRVTTQEPGVVELKDGRVFAWMRTRENVQYCATSSDGAETWSTPVPWNLLSPNSPATVKRLSNGDLVAIWNDMGAHPEYRDVESGIPGVARGGGYFQNGMRAPLTLAVSRNEGRTWHNRRDLEGDTTGWYCYIACLEVDDGLLLGYCARDGLCHARLTRVPLAWLYGPPREDDLTGFFKD